MTRKGASLLARPIAAVCPIHGVSVGRWEDRSTWRIDFKDEATPAERMAAFATMNAFDPDAPENNPAPKSYAEQLVDHVLADPTALAKLKAELTK